MKNITIPISCSLIILLFIKPNIAQTETEAIRLNQVGYYPNGPKMAIVIESPCNQFYITTPDLGDTVFTGNLGASKTWTYSEESVQQADFSDFNTIGSYVVCVPELGYSSIFHIMPRVHQEVARGAIKSYYFQRASTELTEQFAGPWQRPAGHPDDEVLVHASAASAEKPEGTVISSPKGWYDAGDFNKYIVNSGITTYTILSVYEHFPEYCIALETNIPESGDQVPDILDEALWNIRWMLTMQDPNDGGVYHKCTHANFSGMVMPHAATAPRYVVQKSTPATLDFTAVMAQASRLFRNFETEFPNLADSMLTASLNAWNWARQNPNVRYRQSQINQTYSPSINTGEYGDSNFSDEFKWAAMELYVTTKQDSFITAVNPFSDTNTHLPGWPNVATLGFYTLAHYREQLTSAVDTTALKNRLIRFADQIKSELTRSAYGVMIRDFYWGSNSGAANQGIAMIQAYRLTGDTSYLDAAIANLDYILGRNATTYSFVTGYGHKPAMNPHHRQSEADDVTEPIPGLLVGGPNPNQQDNCPGYPSNLPAKSYVDAVCSYASNENAINWNAALVYLTAGMEALKSSTGRPVTITVNITAPTEEATFTSSDEIPIKANASASEGSLTKVEFYANKIKIGEVDSAPYVFNWSCARPGVYQLEAKAVSDMGDFRISSSVNVVVFSQISVGNFLFVVGSPDLNDGDRAIRNFLVGNDYHVTVQEDDDSVAFKIQEQDIILISSTVTNPRNIRAELVNIPVPMISWENTLFDDFGWTGRRRNEDYGSATGSTIDIVDESHPIASGLSGNIQITDSAVDITWGRPNENARIVATVNGDTSRSAIFTYDTEDQMEKNMIAAARRVAFFFSDDNATRLTENGWKLFEAAVDWAQQGTRLSVEDETVDAPASFLLYQNYPNPFNPTTHIHYSLKYEKNVTIKVYNMIGQLVATLVDQKQPYGIHSVLWHGQTDQGDTVGNGIYFYKMQVGDFTQTRKMILMR